ncbi:cytidyltransferase [Salipaludibacillus keqinensis]|uniref:FAD synthase n=1 Tax=Salipaludibacillus keqinensis TaxID=2045207 RepID=A0A323TJ41_9BACI|nr:FAD synthetase family protein [Salipaludibacillus keqinensis]PYZ94838.1 cytidyltransferase [Salipaludibacillus keqinensis]
MKTIKVVYPLSNFIQENSESCVMALGFFDGVHLGHQEIIKTAKRIANQKNLKLAVMTFSPHPTAVIKKGEQVTKYMTPMAIKEKIFKKIGVDILYVVDFNIQVAQIPHDQFVKEYLYGLKCKHVVAGFDYKYGFKGKGNMTQLQFDAKGQFCVTTVEKQEKCEHKVSSTLLRKLISSGRVEDVPTYLGKQYEVEGILKRNRNEYTLHIDSNYFIPCSGSYEVAMIIGDMVTKGVCEVTSNDLPGQLRITTLYGDLCKESSPAQLHWENFIADFDMDVFHAQAHLDEIELSMLPQ